MSIYLDSSFVVALLHKNHEKHPLAEEYFLTLKNSASTVYLSMLTIDEAWYILYKQGLPPRKSISLFTQEFKKILEDFLLTGKIRFPKNEANKEILKTALKASIKYNLRPRDAFHYSYAKNLKANLYTLDQDFTKTNLPVTLLYKALSK